MMAVAEPNFPTHVIALTGERTVDFSLPDGDASLNKAQKDFLTQRLGPDVPEPVSVRQVHGERIIVVDGDHVRDKAALPEADGLMTRLANVPLAIRTADCVPVFLYDPDAEAIALVHAGRQGVANGILAAAVAQMKDVWQTGPAALCVYFGPAIHACCYEVEAFFQDVFPGDVVEKDGTFTLDLIGACTKQLAGQGVPTEKIVDSGTCTCCDQKYFSYRREGEKAGRMISLMMLKNR